VSKPSCRCRHAAPVGNEKVTGLSEIGGVARMVIPNQSPTAGDALRKIESMEPWKGSPKPTMPANKPASSPAKPGQTQPTGMGNQASSTTKKPTGKK
jgi:hypothetical protein